MARDPAAAPRLIPLPVHPWVPILGGLGVIVLSWLIGVIQPAAAPIRVGLALVGTAAALAGVGLRLRSCTWEMPERSGPASRTAYAAMLLGIVVMLLTGMLTGVTF